MEPPLERRGVRNGYFHTDSTGRKVASRDLEPKILERITEVQRRYPGLIRAKVDVYESYDFSRSFRRGSNSGAQNRVVSDSDIDKNNRWRKVDRARSKKPRLIMRNHYTDVMVSFKIFLRNSQPL